MAGGIAALVTAYPTNAADTIAEWLNTSGGNWTTASNWSTNPVVPNNGTPTGATYQVLMDESGPAPYTITFARSTALNGFSITTASAIVDQTLGTLTIPSMTPAMLVVKPRANVRPFFRSG